MKELDELIRISRDGKGWLAELEAKERSATGINSLKVRFNKVFGYYIEVPRSHSERVPDHYVRKQTLVNAERYITDDLKHFESRVLGAEDQRNGLEQDIFRCPPGSGQGPSRRYPDDRPVRCPGGLPDHVCRGGPEQRLLSSGYQYRRHPGHSRRGVIRWWKN